MQLNELKVYRSRGSIEKTKSGPYMYLVTMSKGSNQADLVVSIAQYIPDQFCHLRIIHQRHSYSK